MAYSFSKYKLSDCMALTIFRHDGGDKDFGVSHDYEQLSEEFSWDRMYGRFETFKTLDPVFNIFTKFDSRFSDPSKCIFIKEGYFCE